MFRNFFNRVNLTVAHSPDFLDCFDGNLGMSRDGLVYLWTWKMFPCGAVANFTHCSFGYSKLFSQLWNRGLAFAVEASNLHNYFIRKIGGIMRSATGFSGKRLRAQGAFVLSVFRNHIRSILFDCSGEQVFRVAANRVVARMANEQVWKRSVMVEIRHPVSLLKFLLHSGNAVALCVFRTFPRPAFSRPGGFVYFCPEFLRCYWSSHNKNTPATIEVKPAKGSGNNGDECKNWISLILAAALMPFQNLTPRPNYGN